MIQGKATNKNISEVVLSGWELDKKVKHNSLLAYSSHSPPELKGERALINAPNFLNCNRRH
jgi:hypothetical protein